MTNGQAMDIIESIAFTLLTQDTISIAEDKRDETREALHKAYTALENENHFEPKSYSKGFDEGRKCEREQATERCPFCGGIKRFGICQNCGTDT